MHYVINNAITVTWVLPPTATPLTAADYDIRIVPSNLDGTYTDAAIINFVAPAANHAGSLQFVFTPNSSGKWNVYLATGTGAAHNILDEKNFYVFNGPIGNTAKTTVFGAISYPEPIIQGPGDPGTFALEDLGYLDIRTQTSAELSGNTGNGILDGWWTTDYFFDTGVPDQAVPLSWGDYQEYGTIREAFEHSTGRNLRWGFLNVPAVAGQPDPYPMLDNQVGNGPDYVGTVLRHIFPGETTYGTNFNANFSGGIYDTTLAFMFSAEGGGGGAPVEWNVTVNDNHRIGVGLVGPRLPALSGNWQAQSSNFKTAGTQTFRYDLTADGTNIYIGCNNSEILRSTDGGTTFANCFDLAGTYFFTKIAAGNGIVVAISSVERVFTSTNGGTNWVDRGVPTGWTNVSTLQFFDGPTKYFIAGVTASGVSSLFRSTDGITWTEFGTGIGNVTKKVFPVIGDVGSGLELFLHYLQGSITRLSPTDVNETAYQSPPSATSMRFLYVENGLTIFRDNTNGLYGYNGTTEYSQSPAFNVQPDLQPAGKQGTEIFAIREGLIVHGTSAEWLTVDGVNIAKMPSTFDDEIISQKLVKNGANWVYAFQNKGELYLNAVGI